MQTGIALLGSLWLALSLSQAAPGTQAVTTGQIAGRVTVEGTNTPVARARITLMPGSPPTGQMWMPPQTLTDRDGRFVFAGLAPGSYRIDVQKTGFAPPAVPGRAPATQVSAGQTTEIALTLLKGAVIAGRLLDESGEPATDVSVMAMYRVDVSTTGAAAPRFMPAPGAGQQTNDLGEFRIASLAPGEYYVAVMPGGGSPFGGPTVAPTGNGTTNTITYYPGTADQAAAHTISVAPGETVANIVFSLQSVPSFRVSGRVVDQNDAPVAGAVVMLMGDPASNAFMGPTGNARTDDDGGFTIAEVPSGTYRVSASVPVVMGDLGNAVSSGLGGAFSGGSFSSWSVGGPASGVIGGIDQQTEVIVNGDDVTGVRVIARRPTPQ
jgi:hypothetical protein